MPKLYKAVDVIDNSPSIFLVGDDGRVRVKSIQDEIAYEIINAKIMSGETRSARWLSESRFKDAIDPILIAEW